MLDLTQINSLVEKAEDQTKEQAGGERRVVPAGMAYGRLIEYVELGVQKQPAFQGKAKPDCETVRITFELVTPRHKYTNHEGVEVYDTITWRGAKKLVSKAQFMKLFKKMQRGRAEITHMAQMMNEAFQIEIYHNTSEKDGKTQTWANIFQDSACNISAPETVDPMTGERTTPNIPNGVQPMRLFLWSNPTKECWDSLFIDGTYTVKEGDVEIEKSRNILQNTLMDSPAFVGSALEAMLTSYSTELPNLVQDAPVYDAPEMDDVPF